MGLLSIFSRSKSNPETAADAEPSDSVGRARTRARQRLLGAVVLVGIGIIGFPLLFETQPRPIPVDVPIEIPSRDGAAPLTLPSEREPQAKASAPGASAETAKSEAIITETAAEAGTSKVAEKTIPSAENAETREKLAEPRVERRTEAPPPKPPTPDQQAESARARALLEGKVTPKEAASATRYIVQIGAFADPALARATRMKVERLGLTTYTQIANTSGGDRTRVRVGPVSSREEAEKIAAKIKAAGLPTAILTL